MTPEEFKEKFKVGDYVINQNNQCEKIKITAIGKYTFLAIDDMFKEKWYGISNSDWIKVEPEKKPSEEINDKLVGLTILYTDNKPDIAEYVNKRLNAMQQWLDENWPKVVKK